MKRSVRPLLGIGLPLMTFVVFFVLLTFSLQRLSSIERTMRLEAPHNMLWVISQAQVANLRLAKLVARQALGDSDPESLQRRYNVFLSRLNLLKQGPQWRQMETFGVAAQLTQLDQQLGRFKNHFVALQSHGVENAEFVGRLLDQYNVLLGRAATKAMVTEWDSLGGKLEDARNQLWQIIISLVGILLAGIVLILHLLVAIREARQHSQLLNKEKAFSELVIGSSGEGIMAVDLERRCTVWNNASEQLFNRPSRTAIGRRLDEISGFFDVGHRAQAIGRSLQGKPAVLFDQPFFVSAHEPPRYLDLRCFSLCGNNKIIGAILLVFDVTERRAAQREIAMHRDHLEELVEARTQELDAALERERATAELYRNFGAMVSHQFRTPLAIVDSALQRLIRRSDNVSADEIRDRGDKARDAIKRLVRLIESTLDAARLDAGQIESRNEPCDLGILAKNICIQQRNTSTDRTITLNLPTACMPVAYCDPAHAEHIVTNLLSNAIKYSDAGTAVSMTIRCGDDYVECEVTNQGTISATIDPEALFQRYYRGGNAKGHAGIGIGLYMARALARLQNGDVRLGDGANGSVSFILHLPRIAAPAGLTDTSTLESA